MHNNDRYKTNKVAKIGAVCYCPVCGLKFTKKTKAHAFCCVKHKDKYHNAKGDRHRPLIVSRQAHLCDGWDTDNEDDDLDGLDHEWDESFGVAEYND